MRGASELAPGLELAGAVKLVQKLGEGGMGSVWTADHLALRTQVAVKFLSAHMAQDASAAARFQREATAAARIKSPHIVQIFDHGMSEHFGPYIVMELLDGETVSAFVRRHGRLSPRLTAEIVGQLCKALGKAHALGIVHRDIKPDNVFLIDPEREIFVKVLDFGIAKSLNDELHVTSTGTMMGTPHYMSPEQMLSSKHVDFRADLWAVAVLTYHCLTGSVPFDGETFGAIAIAVAQGKFALPHQFQGVGSPALDAWFLRALSREPNDRFSSAAEMSELLNAAIAGHATPNATLALPPTGTGQSPSGVGLSSSSIVESSVARTAAPTFMGVASTMSGSNSRRTLTVAAGAAALLVAGGALAAVLLLKREPAPEPQIERAQATATPSAHAPLAEGPVVSPTAPATSAPPPTAAATAAEPPPKLPAARPLPPASKPRPKPVAAEAAKPARPDRGF